MASFFSHPAMPVALWISKKAGGSKRLLFLACLLTLLPDIDVVAFKFGIPYASQWGHRGFTHSVTFAFFFALFCAGFSKHLGTKKTTVFIWSFLSLASHIAFDALTNGGLGVAAFWPIDHSRYFFPWTPVQVSPIGVRGFLSMRGVEVVANEVIYLWMPCLALGFIVKKVFRRF
jgi:inner membrane protein